MGVTVVGNIDERSIERVMGDNPTEIILKILDTDEVNDFNRDLVANGRWKDMARFKKDLRIPLVDILSVDNGGITTADQYIPFDNIAVAGHDLDVPLG